MAARSITISSDGLHTTFWRHLDSLSNLPPSAINNIISLLRKSNISMPLKPNNPTNCATYVKIDDSLCIFNKNATNPLCFKKLFNQKIADFSPTVIYYTDGSFQNGLTSYAVVKQSSETQFDIINKTRLPDHTGIFTAEIAAIKTAVTYSTSQCARTLICTDSLSATKALIKNYNIYDDILQLQNNNEVLVIWIPSHIGIQGNEIADNGAKEALNLLLISETPCFPKAITNPFKNIQTQQTSNNKRPRYNKNLTRSQCITLARLRVGKALFNSKYYFEKTEPPNCTFCNVVLTIPHVLSICPVSRIDEPLAKILDCTVVGNVPKIQRCLQKHNIRDV